MTSQRAGVAESPVRNRMSNGPLRAQSNGGSSGVFCDAEGRRNFAGDIIVSC